jgi:hypothetical protein
MFYDTSTESSSLLDFLQPRKPSRPGRGATWKDRTWQSCISSCRDQLT